MRRLIVIGLLVALALPAASSALRGGPGDGSLVVQKGRGLIEIRARGVVFGHVASGRIVLADVSGGDRSPVVHGCARSSSKLTGGKTLCAGTDLTFNLIGGTFKIRVTGTGIDLSLVGRGAYLIAGAGTPSDGTFDPNGEGPRPLPGEPTQFSLGAFPLEPTARGNPGRNRDSDRGGDSGRTSGPTRD